jgi:hypothetical protein
VAAVAAAGAAGAAGAEVAEAAAVAAVAAGAAEVAAAAGAEVAGARRPPAGEVEAGLQKAAASQQLGAGAIRPWVEPARGSNSRRRRHMQTVRVQKQPMCRLLFCDQPAL